MIKKPLLNGKVDTMTKMGTGCFNSNILAEQSPKKSVQASKFSQGQENSSNSGGGFSDMMALHGFANSGDSSPKKNKNASDLHKQALMNSKNIKDKKDSSDYVPDENCTVINEWEKKKSGISKKTPQFERSNE